MRYYVTTPIYYVNSEPHLGHAYTTIVADVLARYHRQRGDDVFFLTGTDEHGTKIAQAAEERGLTPREHVDEMAPKFQRLAAQVDATNDFFIRTTDAGHEAFVQDFVEKMRLPATSRSAPTEASTAPPARASGTSAISRTVSVPTMALRSPGSRRRTTTSG